MSPNKIASRFWRACALALLAGCAGPLSKSAQEAQDFADAGPIGGPPPIQGGSSGSGGAALTPSSARSLFDANVAPIISVSCAGSGCHSTSGATPITFVVSAPNDLYLSVLSYGDPLLSGNFDKSTAQILTQIQGGHFASYTAQDIADISSWLDAEVAAHDGGIASPSAGRQLMAQWSGCMSVSDWTSDGVAMAWATKGSSEGTCQQCHVNGQGFLATQDSARMFTILTQLANPTEPGHMFMEYYFIPDLTTDPANPKMVLNTAQIANAGSGLLPQHPLFDIDGDALDALTKFYNQTQAHLDGGSCGPPLFTP